jgi:flagellar M-ring protein FliF
MSVAAAVDNDRVEETVEKYGADPKVTSEAMREEQDRNRMVMGVPGTLSNRPPPAAANPAAANQQTAGGATDPNAAPADGTARKNATTRQYAYDRSITQTKRSRGRLEKLSVAVVLAQAAAPTPKTGWSPAEIANIDKILRNGLGINAERGDQLVVSAMNFPRKAAPVEWWEERDNIVDISKYAGYAIAALLGYLLLARPLLRLITMRFTPDPKEAARSPPNAAPPSRLPWPPPRKPRKPPPRNRPRWPAPPGAGAAPAWRRRPAPGRWCRCWKTTTCRRRARRSM